MATNDEILERAVRHQLFLTRTASHEANLVRGILDDAVPDLLEHIQRRLDRIKARGFDLGPATTKRLRDMAAGIVEITDESFRAAREALKKELFELATDEAAFTARSTAAAIPVKTDFLLPSPSTLRSLVSSRPILGQQLGEWFSRLKVRERRGIQAQIRQGIIQGEGIPTIMRRLRGTKAMGFRDGVLGLTRHEAETVARTAVSAVSNGARWETFKANPQIVKEVLWVSTLDGRTSAICQRLSGTRYPIDGSRNPPGPPAHPNCLPGDALVTPSGRVTNATKRWYEGDLISIRTASGFELSCTPNHPILTRIGWVPASALDIGMDVVCDLLNERPSPGVIGDHQCVETSIAKIAEAFLASSQVLATEVPTSAEDFHGDGIDGQVAIVGADIQLGDYIEAPIEQPPFHRDLTGSDMGLPGIPGFGRQHEFSRAPFPAGDSSIGVSDEVLSLLGSHSVHAGLLLFGASAQGNLGVSEDSLNGTWRDAEQIRDAFYADAGAVTLDHIVSVQVQSFHGFVFNLQTESGRYVANKIVNHNCRSTITAITKSWRELGIPAKELPASTRASMSGQVPVGTSYDQFLRSRIRSGDTGTVREALGATRAKLFAKGGLEVSAFTDRRGRRFTLKELRRRESGAFRKADIAES